MVILDLRSAGFTLWGVGRSTVALAATKPHRLKPALLKTILTRSCEQCLLRGNPGAADKILESRVGAQTVEVGRDIENYQ